MDVTRLCLIGVGCLGDLTSCDKILDYSADPPKTESTDDYYPVDRLITDKKGRNIDAKITGKGPDSVSFYRKSDGERFEYLIRDLSVKDKAFVAGLPQNRKHKMTRPTPPYIANREKELKQLRRELERLEDKARNSNSGIEKRTIRGEINRVSPQVNQLWEQIETYKRQNPDL
ncbi:MAG: hypothetical protein GWQ05_04315 [Verrucomicrobiaceae bacterium]|nr:hypothetical protein [Verrucomicrobiaceae bacterium]